MRPQYSPAGTTANANRWSALLVADAPLLPLFVVSGALLILSAWLLASPERVVSRTMTWDLLFNLAGAWHLYWGQVAHVDFHDPIGSLNFGLTYLGFRIVGPAISAFVVGQLIITAVLFVAAVLASARRLPLLPAVVFVLFTCQLVLMPVNVGDLADDFTFAMSYNAHGWAILCILSLILFMPQRRLADLVWIDLGVVAALLVALYYIKVTYFAAAIAELVVAVFVCDHVRARRLAWGAVAALSLANAVAPYNWAYLADILAAAESGAIRTNLYELLLMFSANATELSLYAAMLLVAVALWRSERAPLRLPVAAGTLIVGGLAVLTQNAQLRGLPLGIVVAFLLYDHFRIKPALEGHRGSRWVLLAFLILPIANVANESMSLATYYRRATSNAPFFVVDRTNLRGLAVPMEPETLQRSFSSRAGTDYSWLSRSRSIGANLRLSQFAYVQTILEAAALFDEAERRPGGIVLLDQVNPLPFVLGRPPPRRGNLWLDIGFPWQPAEAIFEDANYVLIPKYSTYGELTAAAVSRYGTYLAQHFPGRTETASWTLLSRHTGP
ncbi:MAG: hypothetical protein K9G48_02460 [Reyranella sp.]|nr:hypothetical protein [Reyranella sp.]